MNFNLNNSFNWDMEQHKAYAAEMERRARREAQAQETKQTTHEERARQR